MSSPEERDLAAVARQRAGNEIEHGALAGAVRTDQPDDFAGRDLEADLADGFKAAEALLSRRSTASSGVPVGGIERRGSGAAEAIGGCGALGQVRRSTNGITPRRANCSAST